MKRVHVPARRSKETLGQTPTTVWLLGTHDIFGGDWIEFVTPRGDGFARGYVEDSFWETWIENETESEYTKIIISKIERYNEPRRAA